MSTTDILGRDAADLQSTSDRARAAVKAFHRMQPALTAYARALTGRPDVRVVMSADSNGHTDGKKIFYRPPMALGDNVSHDRKFCDVRDATTRQQMCPACDVREQVLITIYHEIGHIAHGSFAEATETERAQMVRRALEIVDKKYAAALLKRVQTAPDHIKATYLGMAALVSPYLPGIVNALEDARVNAASMEARKGTKIMFEVDTHRILSQGFENKMPDGSIQQVFWRDRPLNAQMVCALYCKSAGLQYREHFVPEVIEALDDKKINEILRGFSTIRNIKGVYTLSIAILLRMRQLGFYQHPTDPQDSEDEPEEQQEEQDEQQDGADSPDAEEDTESEPGDGDGPEGEDGPDSDSDGTGEDEASAGEEEGESDEDGEGSGASESEDSDSDQPSGSGSERDTDGGEPQESDGVESSDEAPVREDDDDDAASDDGAGEGSGSQGSDSEHPESDDGGQGDGVDDESEGEHGEAGGSAEAPDDASADMGGGAGGDGEDESEDGDGEGDDSPAGTGGDHESSEADDLPSTRGDRGMGGDEDADRDAPEGGDSSEQSVDTSTEEADDSDGDESSRNEPADTGDGDPQGSPEPSEDGLDATDDGGRNNLDTPDGVEEEERPIDSGADEGLGGVEVVEDSAFDRLPMGEPEEVNGAIHELAHPEDRPDHVKEEEAGDKEMDRAIVQSLYFETPSRHVHGVREHYWNHPIVINGHNMSQAWDQENYRVWGYSRTQLGVDSDFSCGEDVLGPALLRMRVAFADNKRGKDVHNRKSGKIDARVLGRRAFHGDERLFRRRIQPGKKDYFILIGIDVSGSQIGRNIILTKRAAMAQATLCARAGLKFAIYAHSGNYHQPDSGRAEGVDVDIYHVKEPDEPWTEEVQKRLTELGPDSANLDGHTMEYYRKVLDGRTETHKVLLYYTDGKMPAENAAEELVILQREIKICKKKNYVLMGVGIRTDSPTEHGLETVQVDDDKDIIKVIERLEHRLLAIA